MTQFTYDSTPAPARFGMVILQSDETIELDMHAMRRNCEIYMNRVPNAAEVTPDTLQDMAAHMTTAASLFPQPHHMAAVGYGCTSGTAQIGASEIARLIKSGANTQSVTEPVSALIAACRHLGLRRIAFLSPYIEEVSQNLRDVLADAGIESPSFGTFAEGEDAKVVRISETSLTSAAKTLCHGADVDGIFMSCTSLRTLNIIDDLEAQLGIPVLSSNQVLAWHMGQLGNIPDAFDGPGKLFTKT